MSCAQAYDQMYKHLGWPVPKKVAQLANELNVPKDAAIIDICAGTGLVAEELKEMGYTNIDAHDGSEVMLDAARPKNLYNNFFCQYFNTVADVGNDIRERYDIVVASGGIGLNQMPHDAFDILKAMAVPGGYIVFSIGEWNLTDYGYGDALRKVDRSGEWSRIKQVSIPKYTNMDEDSPGKFKPTNEMIFVYKKHE